MKIQKGIVSLAVAVIVCSNAFAKEDIGFHKKTSGDPARIMATGCVQDAGAAYLSINNVRARIMDEGDMWWDPGAGLPRYYEPANGKACPLFAGSLWIAGLDAGGQLKVAAMTYRQNGEDFWTGPLDTVTVSISPSECAAYDKLFYVTRQEVQDFVSNPGNPAYLTSDIKNWPGNGNSSLNEGRYLAPFVDVVGNGVYDPTVGDYPGYDLKGTGNCSNELYGDATLWWVINDEGNVHTESGGLPIGLEVRAQAFAFQTNDAINNCTFYNWQVINRSSYQMNKTYFGAWTDPDLGNGGEDYVGCDVGRNFGYDYKGVSYDKDGTGNFAGEIGYHQYLPAVGQVFFKGPIADKGDTNCYVHKGIIGMARFVYYNNDFTVMGNPTNASHYYNYLRGLWTDGTPMTYGGNGYQSSSTVCNYMFPWTPAPAAGGTAVNTDPTGCGTAHVVEAAEWDEYKAGDPAGDRRWIESAGPFTLAPGAVNYVTTGVVWDITSTPNNQFLAINLIQRDCDLAQALFDNCFKVLNGPDAPDLTIQELNKELIITISNSTTSNNYKEHYHERSPTIVAPYKDTDYVFEGYEIYQVLDSSVTATQLLDPSVARLVAECDVRDGVTQLVNYTYNSTLGSNVGVLEVNGQDKGVQHSFDVKLDQFQEDQMTNLVNDRPYYYTAIAYGYNNYCTYNPTNPGPHDSLLNGQKMPYLQGRRNVKVYKAFPHIPTAQGYGTIQNSTYGEGPAITRIEGQGNGSNAIELNDASISYILQHDTMAHCTYLPGQGPINVKIVDPLSVPQENFVVKMYPKAPKVILDSTARWLIYIQGVGDTVYSDTTIGFQYEQVIPQWGISVNIQDVDGPYPALGSINNDVLDSSCTMTFADPTKNWLTGLVSTGAGADPSYWIRCGSFTDKVTPDAGYNSIAGDPNCSYDQILGGTWAPYYLCPTSSSKLSCDNGPKLAGASFSTLTNLASVDVVITQDRSKWTRCPVLEEEDNSALAEGNAVKLALRNSPSVDQSGNYALPSATASNNSIDASFIAPKGMGWFPGYAINVVTGERLNMAFGEDSWLTQDGGRDMQWNPDSIKFRQNTGAFFGESSIFGGKHYIYIFGVNMGLKAKVPAYDSGRTEVTDIPVGGITQSEIMGDAMWVNIPLLNQGHSLFESDVTIRIRVAKPYAQYWGSYKPNVSWSDPSAASLNNNFPMYSFSTAGMEVVTNNDSAAKAALNMINVVPNPYYGYSGYESDRLDTRVRITNLPPTCTISIFSVSGTLIQVINKQNPNTYIDWNLQNQYNVPVASGLYLINVNVPNVGERTLKWFGVMRPLDLNSY